MKQQGIGLGYEKQWRSVVSYKERLVFLFRDMHLSGALSRFSFDLFRFAICLSFSALLLSVIFCSICLYLFNPHHRLSFITHTHSITHYHALSHTHTTSHTHNQQVYGRAVGTPHYIAPELLQGISAHSRNVDWWSLGVAAHEMLSGVLPFDGDDEKEIYYKISQFEPASLVLPEELSEPAADLIRALLQSAENRPSGAAIRKHVFFAALDFDSLATQRPPYLPEITSSDDASHFDPVDESELRKAVPRTPARNDAGFDTALLDFVGFSYVRAEVDVGAEASATPGASLDSLPPAVHDELNELRREKASLTVQLSKARAKLRRSNDSAQLAMMQCHTAEESSEGQAADLQHSRATVCRGESRSKTGLSQEREREREE